MRYSSDTQLDQRRGIEVSQSVYGRSEASVPGCVKEAAETALDQLESAVSGGAPVVAS